MEEKTIPDRDTVRRNYRDLVEVDLLRGDKLRRVTIAIRDHPLEGQAVARVVVRDHRRRAGPPVGSVGGEGVAEDHVELVTGDERVPEIGSVDAVVGDGVVDAPVPGQLGNHLDGKGVAHRCPLRGSERRRLARRNGHRHEREERDGRGPDRHRKHHDEGLRGASVAGSGIVGYK